MNNVKLYINKQLVDLNISDLNFPLVKEIADFTDPSRRNGDYSYSIKLPTSKNNMKAFKFINILNAINKFNKTKNYDCQLYDNDNLLIDGMFILTSITESYFVGNITNKFKGDIISLMGNKTLQDIQLPIIDFEGLMISVNDWGTHGTNSYQSGLNMLNPSLGFDFYSLVNTKKISTEGLYGSSIDYSKYYETPLLAYSNFFSNKAINQLNTITNNFGLDNFKPSIKLMAMLKQMFKDIGYILEIDNSLINDTNILLPYFGENSPNWNWLHLSKTSVYTDYSNIQAPARITINGAGEYQINQYFIFPFISSQVVNSFSVGRTQTLKSSNYKIFTDIQNLGTYKINDSAKYFYQNFNQESDSYKLHYTPTNGLVYDFNNNFSILDPAPRLGSDTGWIYTVPADGVYEFDVEIEHNIETYNYTRFGNYSLNSSLVADLLPNSLKDAYQYYPNMYMYDQDKSLHGSAAGYDGAVQGNKTWTYNSQEKWHLGNMLCFVNQKDFDNESFLSSYQNEFDIPSNPPQTPLASNSGNIQNLRTGKKIRNFIEDSVIAYYCPMLRDLYTGNHNQVWENYIVSENSILKNNNTIPTDWDNENEVIKYQGYGPNTQILNYDNQIVYDPATIPVPNNAGQPLSPNGNEKPYNDIYSKTDQLKRKLVRLKRQNFYVQNRDIQYFDNYLPTQVKTVLDPLISRAAAKGIVKFKFRSTLVKGDQIRMYYATAQQFKEAHLNSPYVVQQPANDGPFPIAENWNDPTINGGEDVFGNPLQGMRYNDTFLDEIKINKLEIKCVSDDLYTQSLPLANFLPAISQATFIQDFIKSNNLYFDITNNTILMKTRNDFYGSRSQMDLTSNVTFTTFELNPVALNKNYIYGIKSNTSDDFTNQINLINPTITKDLGNSIYLTQSVSDLTSTVLSSSYDRLYVYREYRVIWNGTFRLSTTITDYTLDSLNLPSYIEGGDSKLALSDSNSNYNRSPRLSYYNGSFDLIGTQMLINDIPFTRIGLKSAISNAGFLENSNKYNFYIDRFTDLTNSSILNINAYIDSNIYSQLDLKNPITIDSTLYYIQSINGYQVLINQLTPLILLKY